MTHASLRPFLNASSWCIVLAAIWCGASAHAVTLNMVTVGNVGNANDPVTVTGTVFGAVNYEYQIGTYEVTIGQYTEFLNAADPNGTNPNGIYNNSMATDANIRGIQYSSGATSGQKYSVIGSPNRPITYVSWFDAARFANWMGNGQGSGSTETGAYTLVGGQTSGTAPARNPGAQFYLPTQNEWYKAAYYSPLLNSGSGGYFIYATQSNADPGNVIGSGSNQANYAPGGVYSVPQAAGYSASQQYLTDVGAYTNSPSYYGTFDQNGNARELVSSDFNADTLCVIRGGDWYSAFAGIMGANFGPTSSLSAESPYIGFRLTELAVVPEPSTCVMTLAGLACGGWSVWRRRNKA